MESDPTAERMFCLPLTGINIDLEQMLAISENGKKTSMQLVKLIDNEERMMRIRPYN